MEVPDYFKRQEELMQLQEQLRLLKRNKNLVPLKRQLRTVNEMYDDLQEKIIRITTNMTAVNECATAIQSTLNHPVKVNVGKENVQSIKYVIETIPQITSNISNVNIPRECELFKHDKINFLQNISSCEERHQKFYESGSLLLSNIMQLTEQCNENGNELLPSEENPLQIQHEVEGCNNFSDDSTMSSFSTTNVIASSPLTCKSKSESIFLL